MSLLIGPIPFVGRGREFRALAQRLQETTISRGGLVLIGGEPGIGKTRLLEEFANAARQQDAGVLWGHCYEGEGAPPLWPWTEILRACVRGASAASLQETLGSGASDIARLLPELQVAGLAGAPHTSGLVETVETAELQFRLFDAVVAFLQRAARRPMLLMLEDLHWADAASLRLLEFAARGLAEAPVLLIGTYRDTETDGSFLSEAIGRLVRLRQSDRFALQGLAAAEVASLVEHVTGSAALPEAVSAITVETGGNPLFVTEIVRALDAEEQTPLVQAQPYRERVLPRTVHEVIGQRLGRLSPGCRHILTIAAIIGAEFSFDVLDPVLEGAGDDLLTALEEAELAQIIVPIADVPGVYRFSHALMRAALYEALPGSLRLRLHRQVGEALERMWGDDPEHLAELAYHFGHAAGAAAKALHYAELAATRSVQLHAYEEGIHQYELALRALAQTAPANTARRATLLLAMAETQNRAGLLDAAVASFEQAAAVARTLPTATAQQLTDQPAVMPAVLLARAALGIGHLAITAGQLHDLLVPLLEESLTALGDAASAQRAMVLSRLAQELMFSGSPERARAVARESVAIARQLGDRRALFACLFAYYYTVSAPDSIAERLAVTEELQQLAEAVRDPELVLRATRRRIEDLLQRSDITAVDAAIQTFARVAELLRQPFYRWEVGLFRAMRALLDGRFADAEQFAMQAHALRLDPDDADGRAFLTMQLWPIRREQERSAELIEAQRELAERFPGVPAHRAALVLMLCECGRSREGRLELAHLAGVSLAAAPRDKSWFSFCAYLAQAFASLGETGAAGALYELARPYPAVIVVVSSAVVCYGSMSRYLGLLAGVIAQSSTDRATAAHWRDRAAGHFDDAITHNERLGAPALLALTLYDYAVVLAARLAADRTAAGNAGGAGSGPAAGAVLVERLEALLGAASVAARELEMAPLHVRIARLQAEIAAFQAAPIPARGSRAALPAGLTLREAELLRLLAAGYSNREIAAALVLTVNTVQNHLRNIYGKLAVRGRAEATAYAFQQGLIEGGPTS